MFINCQMGFPVVPKKIYYNNTFIYNDTLQLFNLSYPITRPCVTVPTLINFNYTDKFVNLQNFNKVFPENYCYGLV